MFWILHQAYMFGYAGRRVPHYIRRIFGGSLLHRAWFLGYTGHFEENGTAYGIANPYPDRALKEQVQ